MFLKLFFVLTSLLFADAIVIRSRRSGGALETEMSRVQDEIESAVEKIHNGRDPEDLMKVKIQIESLQSRSKRLRDEIALATDFENQLTDTVSKTVDDNVKFLLNNRTQEQQNSVFRVVEKVADRLMEEMVNKTKSSSDSEEKAMKDAIRRAEEDEKKRTEEANMVDEPLKATGSMESAAAAPSSVAGDSAGDSAAAGAAPDA